MRIVAIGGSHTVGYGLDDVKFKPFDTVSDHAYPSLVAKHFNCDIMNLGKCGNGIDQIYLDVLEYIDRAEPDDFLILQVTTKIHWFTLITSDNKVVKIVNPDSLDFKGPQFQNALHQMMATLTNDAHWQRIWFGYFFGLINLLQKSNTKFVWFFDRYFHDYSYFEEAMIKFQPEISEQLRRIKNATDALQASYLGRTLSEFLDTYCPHSQMENGHYNEIGHRFWADRMLIPYISGRLTK